jgi:hypothetical protein
MQLESLQKFAAELALYIGWINATACGLIMLFLIAALRRPMADVIKALIVSNKLRLIMHGFGGVFLAYVLGELRWATVYIQGDVTPLDDLFWSLWELSILSVVGYLILLMAVGRTVKKDET